jgi:hypothetical protein
MRGVCLVASCRFLVMSSALLALSLVAGEVESPTAGIPATSIVSLDKTQPITRPQSLCSLRSAAICVLARTRRRLATRGTNFEKTE